LRVANGNDARVVDLGLDKRGGVKVSFPADLDGDTTMGALVIIDGLGTGLNVRAYTVIIAGRERLHVVESMESDGIFWGIESNGTSVTSYVALGNIVGGFYAKEETITAKDGVRGERWALEKVKSGAGMESRLFVCSVDNCRLLAFIGVKS